MRHLLSRTLIRFSLRSSYRYWKIRQLFARSVVWIRFQWFEVISATGESTTKLSILAVFVKSSFTRLLISTIMAMFICLPALIVEQSTSPSPLLIEIFGSIDQENRGSYDGVLIAVITVIGIFLTLYFTNLNTVVGTLYADIPHKVRRLLIEERVGNVFTDSLIVLTILSLILLIVATLTDVRPTLAIVVIGVGGILSVLTFVQLAKRTFVFFDPTFFADVLLNNILDEAREVSNSGYQWKDEIYQEYHHKLADEAISGLKVITEIALDNKHLKGEAATRLFSNINNTLVGYINYRRRIPTTSKWYRYVPHFENWYFSNYSKQQLASATDTNIVPDYVPNHFWLEGELTGLLLQIIHNTKPDPLESTLPMLQNTLNLYRFIGFGWSIDFALKHLQQIRITVGTDNKEDSLEGIQIIHMICVCPIELLLGFIESVRQVNINKLSNSLVSTNWEDTKSIYELGLPTPILERLEYLHPRILFEIKTEGNRVSPDWYLRELVFHAIDSAIFDRVTLFIDLISDHYISPAKLHISTEEYVLAFQYIDRGFEYLNKIEYHLPVIKDFVNNLSANNEWKSLKWADWKWLDYSSKIDQAKDELTIMWAKSIIPLSHLDHSHDKPDWLGRAISHVDKALFNALLNKKSELSLTIFPYYLQGAFNSFFALKEASQDWDDVEHSLIFSVEPVLDLLSLSGFVIILSEFHQLPELWATCKEIWQSYLSDSERRSEVFKIINWGSFALRTPAITPASIKRSNWEQIFTNNFLRSLPRKSVSIEDIDWISFAGVPTVVDHPSLMIRSICGRDAKYNLYTELNPICTFIDEFLRDYDELKEGRYGFCHYNLQEQLQNQREFESEYNFSFASKE